MQRVHDVCCFSSYRRRSGVLFCFSYERQHIAAIKMDRDELQRNRFRMNRPKKSEKLKKKNNTKNLTQSLREERMKKKKEKNSITILRLTAHHILR